MPRFEKSVEESPRDEDGFEIDEELKEAFAILDLSPAYITKSRDGLQPCKKYACDARGS